MSTFNRVNDGCSTVADQMYRTSYGDKKDMYRLSEVFTLFVYSSLEVTLHNVQCTCVRAFVFHLTKASYWPSTQQELRYLNFDLTN